MKPKIIVPGIIIILLIVGGVFLLKSGKTGPLSPSSNSENLKIKGSASAPVQIIEFSDFQCPACNRARPVLEDLLETYPGKVAVVFKHFPLQGHLWAGIAHQAAECAHKQGQFWPYHDKLYDEQTSWSGPNHPLQTFLQYGRDLNLDLEKFGSCLGDPEVQKSVLADRQEGVDRKIRSTPTLFINDKIVVGPIQLQVNGEKYVREILGLPELSKAEKKEEA